MARIEVSLNEYNSLKRKIKDLEDTLNDVSKESAAYKEKLKKLEMFVSDLENETVSNRIFKWYKIINRMKKIFE